MTEPHSAIAKTEPDPTSSTPSPSGGVSKKERKALKKQKAKARKDGDDDFDRVLDELSNKFVFVAVTFRFILVTVHIRYRDTHLASPTSSKGKGVSSRSLPGECYKLLSVSLSHLNPDIEMRRFFGAKVIATSRNEAGSSSSRSRRQPITQRSNLTRPQPNWWPAKLREGLTLRPLSDEETAEKASLAPWSNNEEKYWTAEYSKKYKGATSSFMRTVFSGGALFSFPNQNPPILSVFVFKTLKDFILSCANFRGTLIHYSSWRSFIVTVKVRPFLHRWI